MWKTATFPRKGIHFVNRAHVAGPIGQQARLSCFLLRSAVCSVGGHLELGVVLVLVLLCVFVKGRSHNRRSASFR